MLNVLRLLIASSIISFSYSANSTDLSKWIDLYSEPTNKKKAAAKEPKPTSNTKKISAASTNDVVTHSDLLPSELQFKGGDIEILNFASQINKVAVLINTFPTITLTPLSSLIFSSDVIDQSLNFEHTLPTRELTKMIHSSKSPSLFKSTLSKQLAIRQSSKTPQAFTLRFPLPSDLNRDSLDATIRQYRKQGYMVTVGKERHAPVPRNPMRIVVDLTLSR